MYMYMYMYIYIYIYTHIYVCIYVCIFLYVYIPALHVEHRCTEPFRCNWCIWSIGTWSTGTCGSITSWRCRERTPATRNRYP